MQTIFTVTQVICGALVCVLVLVLLIGIALAAAGKLFEKSYRRGEKMQYDADMNRLRTYSYWFSEDEPTMNLIKNLAEVGDVSRVRDLWRSDRENQKGAP